MPELPEVETIRRDLEEKILGKKISQIKVRDEKVLTNKTRFIKEVVGEKITKLERRGKILVLELSSGKSILVHLKMTGQLIFWSNQELIAGGHSLNQGSLIESLGGELPNKHTRVIFSLKTGEKLFFNDLRRFGYIKLVNLAEKQAIFAQMGPEPLSREFSFELLQTNLKKRKIAIKKALLDQKLVVGIGNIYADEVLFLAGIHPERLSNSLKIKEIRALYLAIKKILQQGIKHRGTTFSNYLDGQGKQGNFYRFLKVYNRKGQKCFNCQGEVKKIKLANRGTHYCPKCQK